MSCSKKPCYFGARGAWPLGLSQSFWHRVRSNRLSSEQFSSNKHIYIYIYFHKLSVCPTFLRLYSKGYPLDSLGLGDPPPKKKKKTRASRGGGVLAISLLLRLRQEGAGLAKGCQKLRGVCCVVSLQARDGDLGLRGSASKLCPIQGVAGSARMQINKDCGTAWHKAHLNGPWPMTVRRQANRSIGLVCKGD